MNNKATKLLCLIVITTTKLMFTLAVLGYIPTRPLPVHRITMLGNDPRSFPLSFGIIIARITNTGDTGNVVMAKIFFELPLDCLYGYKNCTIQVIAKFVVKDLFKRTDAIDFMYKYDFDVDPLRIHEITSAIFLFTKCSTNRSECLKTCQENDCQGKKNLFMNDETCKVVYAGGPLWKREEKEYDIARPFNTFKCNCDLDTKWDENNRICRKLDICKYFQPCKHGHFKACHHDYNKYLCECKEGYFGPRCENSINLCEADRNPCGLGFCMTMPGLRYKCNCPKFWEQDMSIKPTENCESRIGDCEPEFCKDRGHCDGKICRCSKDYYGNYCQHQYRMYSSFEEESALSIAVRNLLGKYYDVVYDYKMVILMGSGGTLLLIYFIMMFFGGFFNLCMGIVTKKAVKMAT